MGKVVGILFSFIPTWLINPTPTFLLALGSYIISRYSNIALWKFGVGYIAIMGGIGGLTSLILGGGSLCVYKANKDLSVNFLLALQTFFFFGVPLVVVGYKMAVYMGSLFLIHFLGSFCNFLKYKTQ